MKKNKQKVPFAPMDIAQAAMKSIVNRGVTKPDARGGRSL
jgi:hypothetical protein